jgi:hypothetical protein
MQSLWQHLFGGLGNTEAAMRSLWQHLVVPAGPARLSIALNSSGHNCSGMRPSRPSRSVRLESLMGLRFVRALLLLVLLPAAQGMCS